MPAASALKVLVVDDQMTMRALVRSSLQQMGVSDIADAADGELGLQSLLTRQVNLAYAGKNQRAACSFDRLLN